MLSLLVLLTILLLEATETKGLEPQLPDVLSEENNLVLFNA